MSAPPRPSILAAIATVGAILLWWVTRDLDPAPSIAPPGPPRAADPARPSLLPIQPDSNGSASTAPVGSAVNEPAMPRPRRGVFGRVRCADGAPADGATIAAHALGEAPAPTTSSVPVHPLEGARELGSTQADRQGEFALGDLPTGPYRLTARHPRGRALSEPLFVTLTRATGPVELRLADAARLAGRVVGPTGDPVARADVALLASNQRPAAPQRVRSADDGSFVLEVEPGRHCVRVAASGFVPQLYFDLSAPSEHVQIVLVRGGRIAGTVVAREDGRPLAGARIDGQLGDWHEQATTDAEGAFHFDSAPAGEVLLGVSAPERAPRQRLVRVASGREATLEIPLAAGLALEGSLVEDKGGLPLAGAWIIAQALEPGAGAPTRAQTADDGRFRLAGLPRGAHRVWVASDAHALAAVVEVFLDPALPRPTLELRARPIARVEGRLVGPTDESLAGTTVRISARTPSTWLDRSAVSDDAGRFTLAVAVLDTELDLVADHPRLGTTYFGPLRLAAGEVLRVEVPLLVGARLAGKVRGRASATPISGAVVTLLALGASADALDERAHAASARDGSWSISGVAPGARWMVRAEAPAHATWYSDPFEVEAGRALTLEIDLEPAVALAGRVYDGDGPVVGASLEAADAATRRFLGRTTSGSGGAYELGGLPAGPYLLSVHASGRSAATREIAAAGPGVDIELARERSITIEVELPDGYPLEYYVRAYAESDPGAAPALELSSGPSHTSHTLGPLPEGRYRVLVDGPGLVPVERSGIEATEEGGAVLRVLMERGQLAVGLVVDEKSGAPVHGATILRGRHPATLTEKAALEQGYVIESTHPDGSYHVTGFGPEPRAWITIVHEGYRTRQVEIEVGASAAQRVTLSRGLELGVRVTGTGAIAGRSIRIEGPVAREASSDDAGRARFAGLEPGRYVARIDGRADAIEFELPRERELELPLE